MRTCKDCSSEKPLTAFTAARPECNPCRSKRRRNQYEPSRQRDKNLRASFGIGLDDYAAMLDRQGGVCAICEGVEPISGRALPVGHCHSTGAIRGILCSSCNQGLGKFFDNPALLRAAAAYLENPPCQS